MAGTNDDIQLLEAFLRGESSAVAGIHGFINGALYGFVDSLDQDELQDIRSETLDDLRSAAEREQYRGESALSSYVVRITCTNAIDEIRRKKRQVRLLREVELTELPIPRAFLQPDQEYDWNEFIRLLIKGIRRLPLECVRLLRMHVRDGLPYERIAAEVKKKANRLRGRMLECRKMFRRTIEEFGIIDKQL